MNVSKGQFFIITAVLIAGALVTTMTIISSSQTVDYNDVLERHSTDIMENIAHDIQSEWWNISWSYRKNLVVEEQSGLFLDNESVAVTVDALRSRLADDCSDIRLVDGGEVRPWINTTACGIDTYGSETDAVARYRLDEREGTTAGDATGHGHDGSLEGDPQWVSGRFSSGVGFDADDSIEVDDDAALDFTGEGFTVAFWVFPREDVSGDRGQLFVKGDGQPNGGRNYAMWINPGQNTVRFRVDPNNQGIGATDTELSPGRWYHVAGIYDSDDEELRFYLDGRLDGRETGVTMDGNSDNDGDLHIGESPNHDSTDMVVDDFRIYNRTLAQNTVEGIARNGIGLNISVDASPRGERTVQVYYGNPSASHPGHERTALEFTAMEERPTVTVGTARHIREIMRKLQERVETMDRSLGADLRLIIRRGCNQLTYREPRTSLVYDLC